MCQPPKRSLQQIVYNPRSPAGLQSCYAVAMDSSLVQPLTQSDRLFDSLENAIVTGEFPLGSRLGEEALARRFGASRGPLREALRRLEGRGLVVRLPHAGVRVVSLDEADLDELYDIRVSLEGTATRLATERSTEAEIGAFRTLVASSQHLDSLREGRHSGVLDLHYLIAKASRSRRLERLLCGELYSLIRLCRFALAHTPGKPERARRDHERIIDAIEDRDGELAELLMRRHVEASRSDFQRQRIQSRDPVAYAIPIAAAPGRR